jgi:hypothetical protein
MTRRQILTYSIAVALLLASASQAGPALDLCSIPVYKNVDAEIERCYFSCISVRARANFEAEFGLRIDEVDPEFMDWDVYFDGGNTIPGDGNWHTLSVCVVAWNPTNFLEGPDPEALVSTVTITVRPPVESMTVVRYVQIEKCSDYKFLLQPVECVIDVDIDIKPGSCPNPFNGKSKGVLPVAILGAEDFDVTAVDIASVRLAGVAPIRSSFEDVATPLDDDSDSDIDIDEDTDLDIDEDTDLDIDADTDLDFDADTDLDIDADADLDIDPDTDLDTGTDVETDTDDDVDGDYCDCTTAGPDGFTDLTLKFRSREIVHELGEVNHGEKLRLKLEGELYDGTAIAGADCIVVRGKYKSLNGADINKDGVVNGLDLVIVTENWLQSSIVK